MIDATIRRPLLADAAHSLLMDALTGGSFLAGLGIPVGAGNLELALLAALPFLAQAGLAAATFQDAPWLETGQSRQWP